MPRGQRLGSLLLAIAGLAAAAGTMAPLLSAVGAGPGGAAIRMDVTAWGSYVSGARSPATDSAPAWGFAIAVAAIAMFACGGSLAVTTRFAHGARTVGLVGVGVLIGGTWQLGVYLRALAAAAGRGSGGSPFKIGPGAGALVLACLLGLVAVVVLTLSARQRNDIQKRVEDPPTIPTGIAVVRLPDTSPQDFTQ